MNKQKGFTLLELLVVLVIVGMTASFAGPNVWHTYVKASERASVQAFADSIVHLREQAFHRGKAVRLPAVSSTTSNIKDSFMPTLEDGWELESSTPLRFLPSGVTNGGLFKLRSPMGSQWQLTLAPLDGRIGIRRL